MRDDLFRAVLIGDGEDILCGNRIDRAVRIVPSLVFDFRVGYFSTLAWISVASFSG